MSHSHTRHVHAVKSAYQYEDSCKTSKRHTASVFLGWAGLGWAGLGWAGLGWAGLGWAGLGWAGLGWAGLDCNNLVSHLVKGKLTAL